jgi:hypothetical protein
MQPPKRVPAMPSRAVSLSAEILELEGVVTAAKLLVDLLRYDQWGEEGDVRRIPRATSAVLAMLECRMKQTARALRGEANPDTILAQHNEAINEEEGLLLPVEGGHVRGGKRR